MNKQRELLLQEIADGILDQVIEKGRAVEKGRRFIPKAERPDGEAYRRPVRARISRQGYEIIPGNAAALDVAKS